LEKEQSKEEKGKPVSYIRPNNIIFYVDAKEQKITSVFEDAFLSSHKSQ